MQIKITYGTRHLRLKVPAYVVLPPDPDARMRTLLNEAYFSGEGTDSLPDEPVRLQILADIALHLGAIDFLRNDMASLLDDESRGRLASAISKFAGPT